MIADGWLDHKPWRIGGGWGATAEYFKDGKPTPRDGLCGTIVSCRNMSSAVVAWAEVERRKALIHA